MKWVLVNNIIDISVPMRAAIPFWPGNQGMRLVPCMRTGNGDAAKISHCETDVCVNAHLHTPRHFFPDGKSAEQSDLHMLIGRTVVAELSAFECVAAHDLAALDLAPDPPHWAERVTGSRLPARKFVDFTTHNAAWLVDWGQTR